jgi:hypothetical protein
VTDGPGGELVPARLVLYDQSGAPLRIGMLDMYDGTVQDRGYCELADGAVGTWQGIALARGDASLPVGVAICDGAIAIPYGRYHARVMRGAEYEFFETDVDLEANAGHLVLTAPLERAFPTDGALAADLHVHAQNSGDSTMPRRIRVITEAAAGIQVIGSSDHNYNGDYAEEIAALGLSSWVTSLAGDEISIDVGHFNAFPMDPQSPRSLGTYDAIRAWSARTLLDTVRALPQRPFLFINHPRLGFAAYFDMAGWNGLSWPPPAPVDFDGLEVLTGWTAFNDPAKNDLRLDRCVADFYTLWTHGQLLTALGNSDTHHLNTILAGFPRTWVWVPDARPDHFDELAFLDALRGHRAVATTGPWLDVRAGGGAGPGDLVPGGSGHVDLSISVRQASFVHANRVRVIVGGEVREQLTIPPGQRAFDWSGSVTVGPQDTWIGVDASGDDPLPPDLVGDYLEGAGHPGMLPFALANPIGVDVDGDGRVTLRRRGQVEPQPPDLLPPAVIPGGERGPYDCGEETRR